MGQSAAQQEEKRSIVLSPGRFKEAHYERNIWVVTAPDGATPEDVTKEEFWAHFAAKMKPYDKVEIRVDSGEWYLEGIVRDCGQNWARIKILHKYPLLDGLDPSEEENSFANLKHYPKWCGPHKKWCVVRKTDGLYVQEGLPDKAAAINAILTHENKR